MRDDLVPKSVPVRLADPATAAESAWPGVMWGTAATAGTQVATIRSRMRMEPNPSLVGEHDPVLLTQQMRSASMEH